MAKLFGFAGFATAQDGISTKQDNIKLPLRLAQSEFCQRGPNILPGGEGPRAFPLATSLVFREFNSCKISQILRISLICHEKR